MIVLDEGVGGFLRRGHDWEEGSDDGESWLYKIDKSDGEKQRGYLILCTNYLFFNKSFVIIE